MVTKNSGEVSFFVLLLFIVSFIFPLSGGGFLGDLTRRIQGIVPYSGYWMPEGGAVQPDSDTHIVVPIFGGARGRRGGRAYSVRDRGDRGGAL